MGRLVRSSDLLTNIPVAIQGSHSIAFRGGYQRPAYSST